MKQCNLTSRQQAFCREYILDRNASRAYIRAGYSSKGANALASRLMANDSIQRRITELEAPIIKKAGIEAEDVISQQCYMTQVNYLDAVDEEGRCTLKHLKTLPVELQRCVRGWKFNTAGDLEIKWADQDKVWEMLTRHFGLAREQLVIKGELSVTEVVKRALQAKRGLSNG
jgi:phage terminase small subunit